MTEAEAFKRAVFWLGVLLNYTQADPTECVVRVTIHDDDDLPTKEILTLSLDEDLREFERLGADTTPLGEIGGDDWEDA